MSQVNTALSKDEKPTARAGGQRLLSLEDLRKRGLRWSRQWLRLQIKAGRFPKPIKIGENTNAWLETEWNAWLEAKAAEREVA